MNVWAAEFAIHHLKDSLKFIIELRFLDVGINNFQVDMLGKELYRFLNVD